MNASDPRGPESGAALRQRVRATVDAELRSLSFPRRGHLDDLCRCLAERRGRPVLVRAADLPVPGPFGLWLARPDHDEILYPRHSSPQYRMHIVLHEMAHVLLRHDLPDEAELHQHDEPVARAPVTSALASFLDRWAVLERRSYDHVVEREAEVGASLLRRRVRLDRPRGDQQTRRVQDALGGDDEP